jgi:hypothetical protein
MKKSIIIIELFLLSYCINSYAAKQPKFDHIIALPEEAGATFLAYNWTGDLAWFDNNLTMIEQKHYDYAIPDELIIFKDGLLIKSELKKTSEHSIHQLSMLSFSGEVLHEWQNLPDSIWTINAQKTPLSYIGFSDEKFQLGNNNKFVSTGIHYGRMTTIMPLSGVNTNDNIICTPMTLSMHNHKLANCHRTGSKTWVNDNGYWTRSPKLCGDYLVESNRHKPNKNKNNWQLIVRDLNTGKEVSQIDAPSINDYKCNNNQLITIGESIGIYTLPNNTPIAVKYCPGGKRALDIAVNKKQMVCIDSKGKAQLLVDNNK